MATTGKDGVQGPLFEEGTDILDIAAHLIELGDNQAIKKIWSGGNTSHQWVTSLILLDIAHSLRKLTSAPALNSPYRSPHANNHFRGK